MSANFSSTYKLLVVDDVPTNILLLKVTLEHAGLQVLTAESAADALKQLEANKVDLILLDIMMPDVNGFEFAQQLKNHLGYKEIPIIFLTALDSPADIVKGFQLGAEDYIPKPFNKEELIIRVRHQLKLLDARRTIQRQAEELQKTIEGRDRLYSVIAHDLRAPMSSLKMMFNALTLKMSEQPHCGDLLDMLQNANEITEQLFILLDNLLKWTRSQLGNLEAMPQVINLSELTQGVVEVFSMTAEAKKIEIRYKSAPSEKTNVFIDIDMIKSAIRNLLSNAIKFSYPDSVIEVEVTVGDREIIFTVSDHGRGISENNQHKLMDVATHYSTFGTAQESGSGLGLLLVNEFLKLNRGRLFFRSEEGKGSTFGFAVPSYPGEG